MKPMVGTRELLHILPIPKSVLGDAIWHPFSILTTKQFLGSSSHAYAPPAFSGL